MERWLRSSRIGCTIAHGTHAANRRNTHEQMRKLTRGQAPLTAPKNSGRHRRRRRTYTIIQVEIDPNTGNISTVRSREWERLPSQAPRSSGGCRQRRLGGCTIVQVENVLKGTSNPGSSRATVGGRTCRNDGTQERQEPVKLMILLMCISSHARTLMRISLLSFWHICKSKV